jgi:hypothetical protein
MARNSIAKKSVNTENGSVTFNFSNGKTATVSLFDFDSAMYQRFALHGMSQKFGDVYAGIKDPNEAFAAFQETVEAAKAGDWRQTAERTGDGGAIIDAILRVRQAAGSDISRDEVVTKWSGYDEATQKKVRSHPDIKAALAQIAAERAAERAAKAEAEPADVAELF